MKLGRFEIKRVENTVWDYLGPVSLVVLAFMVMIYSATSNLRPSISDIYWEILDVLLIILLTIFLTRFQRILLNISLPIISTLFTKILETINLFPSISDPLIKIFINIFFLFAIINAGFFIGNVSLLLVFGNNREGKKTKKINLFTIIPAFALYGFFIDFSWLYTFPTAGTEATPFLLAKLPYGSDFFFGNTIVFALIGFAIGMYKYLRGSKN